MAIAVNTGVVRLPFADRPAFGSPYPEGIAVAGTTLTGDASGGDVTLVVLSDGGFLYRVEKVGLTKGDALATTLALLSSHRWASDRSGLGPTTFDLNWITTQVLAATFSVFSLAATDFQQIRRFPIGRTDAVALQTIFQFGHSTNVNTRSYQFDLVMSYWRTESMYRPGFLQSFWESPVAAVEP